MFFLKKWIYKLLPSSRYKRETAKCYMKNGCVSPYEPIPIYSVKLTWAVRLKLNRFRKNPVLLDQSDKTKKLAIIVPYRDRAEHLESFIPCIREFITKQGIDFEIFIVEQNNFDKPFNRGKLLNVGFDLTKDQFDYFCFHDVDMLPDNSDYGLISQPALLTTNRIDPEKGNFFYPESNYFSGAILLTKDHYNLINGYTNCYWGWGCEDEDLLFRCLFSGLVPVRLIRGKYNLLTHPLSITQNKKGEYETDKVKVAELKDQWKSKYIKVRKMRRGLVDFQKDGLNTLNYNLVSKKQCDGYQMLIVNI